MYIVKLIERLASFMRRNPRLFYLFAIFQFYIAVSDEFYVITRAIGLFLGALFVTAGYTHRHFKLHLPPGEKNDEDDVSGV